MILSENKDWLLPMQVLFFDGLAEACSRFLVKSCIHNVSMLGSYSRCVFLIPDFARRVQLKVAEHSFRARSC